MNRKLEGKPLLLIIVAFLLCFFLPVERLQGAARLQNAVWPPCFSCVAMRGRTFLAMDGEVKSSGKVLKAEEIKAMLASGNAKEPMNA